MSVKYIKGDSVKLRFSVCHVSEPLETNTHTHPFNGPLSGTTRVSQYQKGKANLDFTEARVSEWQWQVCTSLRTDNHASTPPLSFFTGRMPFLPPNQQRQSTEGTMLRTKWTGFHLNVREIRETDSVSSSAPL